MVSRYIAESAALISRLIYHVKRHHIVHYIKKSIHSHTLILRYLVLFQSRETEKESSEVIERRPSYKQKNNFGLAAFIFIFLTCSQISSIRRTNGPYKLLGPNRRKHAKWPCFQLMVVPECRGSFPARLSLREKSAG